MRALTLKDEWRTDLLLKQFQLDQSVWSFTEVKKSLTHIYEYVSSCTKIVYLEFIDEEILYDYIKYHSSNHFNEISFKQAIQDVKNYISFLQTNRYEYIPEVNLSVKNYKLWSSLS